MRFYFVLTLTLSSLLMLFHTVKLEARGLKYRRSIFINLVNHPGLWVDDVVVLKGRFLQNNAQIRFISSENACHGGIFPGRNQRNCQPLVVKFYPGKKMVTFSYKGALDSHLDIDIDSKYSDHIQPNSNYTLEITVKKESYVVVLNGEDLATVRNELGSDDIRKLRSYGGLFSKFYVQRAPVTCGKRPGFSDGTLRIVGGSRAAAGEFPWQAAIRLHKKSPIFDSKHACAATIIDSCWLVTAAHCAISKTSLHYFHVRVGDYYNRDGNNYAHYEDVQDFEIAEIISHPGFTLSPSPRDDIALIRLRTNTSTCINFSNFVQPICLPRANENFPPPSTCSISGWGVTTTNTRPAQYAPILQKANVKIQDHIDCQQSHGRDSSNNFRVANETVCAADKGIDSCQGDSGGPMSCQRYANEKSYSNVSGPHVLWGITSWGDDCAHPDKAGVYTKVVDYLDWIEESMRNSSTAQDLFA